MTPARLDPDCTHLLNRARYEVDIWGVIFLDTGACLRAHGIDPDALQDELRKLP